ncbi:MAG: tryptophan transporter [Clostridiaceae bacterium]
MNLRKLTLSSLLLAIGVILHQITPPIFLGMKPDFSLAMVFIAILICDDYKSSLVIGFAAGILAALTTGFPGGQLPNIIDKFLTANFVFLLYTILKDKVSNQVKIIIVSIIGTIFSGCVFLGSAFVLVGLPGSFLGFVYAIVLPAAALNCVATIIFYNAVTLALKSTSIKY